MRNILASMLHRAYLPLYFDTAFYRLFSPQRIADVTKSTGIMRKQFQGSAWVDRGLK